MSDGTSVNLVAINGSAGALTTLFGTILSRRIDIIEDYSANAGVGQGLTYYLVDPINTTNPQAPVWKGPFSVAPQTEPIILGDPNTIHQPYGSAVSNGPGVILGVGVTGALPYMQIKSYSTTATVIRTTEYA